MINTNENANYSAYIKNILVKIRKHFAHTIHTPIYVSYIYENNILIYIDMNLQNFRIDLLLSKFVNK